MTVDHGSVKNDKVERIEGAHDKRSKEYCRALSLESPAPPLLEIPIRRGSRLLHIRYWASPTRRHVLQPSHPAPHIYQSFRIPLSRRGWAGGRPTWLALGGRSAALNGGIKETGTTLVWEAFYYLNKLTLHAGAPWDEIDARLVVGFSWVEATWIFVGHRSRRW